MKCFSPPAIPRRGTSKVLIQSTGFTFGPRCLLALAISLPGLSMGEIKMAAPQQTGISNGVPVIGITNPNSKGLSHNRFEHFDVAEPGVIFNNSLKAGASQLGGWLAANPNLTHTAKAILAEVTGNQPSTLAGTLEVFGDNADVIVANPNGLTLNGVKTLNTRSFIASTGIPDADDVLHLNVQSGQAKVVVGAGGVDTQGLSYFDIVARTVALHGQIGALGGSTDVQIVAGLNRYNSELHSYEGIEQTVANVPVAAIEGSLAGAMHGRNITLTSSESGVGVRHAGLINAAQDIRIQANGDINLSSATAGRHIELDSTAKVTSKGETANASIQAAGNIQIKAEHIELGVATRSDRFAAMAKSLSIIDTTLKAGANDPSNAAVSINVDDLLLAGALVAYDSLGRTPKNVIVRGGKLQYLEGGRYFPHVTVASTARIESAGGININAKHIHNNQGIIESRGSQELRIVADTLDNQGVLHSDAALDISTEELNNRCIDSQLQSACLGIFSNQTASIKTDLLNNWAGLAASGDMTLQLGHGQHRNERNAEIISASNLLITRRAPGTTSDLLNNGTIVAKNNGRIIQDGFDNGESGVVSIGRDLLLQAYSTFVSSGFMGVGNSMDISTQAMQLNRGSLLHSHGTLQLNAEAGFVSEQGAIIQGGAGLAITSRNDLYNAADIDSGGDIVMRAGGNLTNTSGVFGNGNVEISSDQTITNKDGGLMAGNSLTLTANRDIINKNLSTISSDGGLLLQSSGAVLNDDFSMIDGRAVSIAALVLRNQANSIIHGWDGLQIHVTHSQHTTTGASIMVNGQIIIQAGQEQTPL